jgi:hypothetical protein
MVIKIIIKCIFYDYLFKKVKNKNDQKRAIFQNIHFGGIKNKQLKIA